MTINVGVRLHDVDGNGFKEKVELAHQQGFKCIHLAVNKVEKDFKYNWFCQPYANKMNEILSDNKIELAILGCYKNLAHPNKEKMDTIIKEYEAHIDFAAMLKQSVVGTETGCPNEDYSFDENTHTEKAIQTVIENLKKIVPHAEKKGVILAIEPVYKHIICSSKVARRVLDEVNSPNLKIILDPVNLLAKENIHQKNEIIQEAINLLKEDIVAVHIKDFRETENDLEAIRCGLGSMNYDAITQFIANKKGIPVTLENTNSQNAKDARNFIVEKIKKAQ